MNSRWLLVFCGVLNATIALLYFRHVEFGTHALRDMRILGRLLLVSGICTVVLAIWKFAGGKRWLLLLNGVALGVLGSFFAGAFGNRIRLLVVGLILCAAAVSSAGFELSWSRALMRAAGAISICFAFVFAALALHWIHLGMGSRADTIWIGSYFAFSALVLGICASTGASWAEKSWSISGK